MGSRGDSNGHGSRCPPRFSGMNEMWSARAEPTQESPMSDAVQPLRIRLSALLDAHDRPGAVAETLGAVESGEIGLKALYHDVLSPLMTDIGDRWQQGQTRVWEEHFASATVRTIVEALYPQVQATKASAAPSGHAVVLACPADEAARPRPADARRHVRRGGLDDVPARRRHTDRPDRRAPQCARRGPRAPRVVTFIDRVRRSGACSTSSHERSRACASWWRAASRTARSGACARRGLPRRRVLRVRAPRRGREA